MPPTSRALPPPTRRGKRTLRMGYFGSLFVANGGKANDTCEEPIGLVIILLANRSQAKLIYKASKLWEDNPEKWKWAYEAVEMEARRTQTMESEIVDAYWKFTVPSKIPHPLVRSGKN